MIAEENQDEKEEPGAGHKCQTASVSRDTECLFQSLSHQTKPVWVDKQPSQEGYTLHIAKSNGWSQIKDFKNP